MGHTRRSDRFQWHRLTKTYIQVEYRTKGILENNSTPFFQIANLVFGFDFFSACFYINLARFSKIIQAHYLNIPIEIVLCQLNHFEQLVARFGYSSWVLVLLILYIQLPFWYVLPCIILSIQAKQSVQNLADQQTPGKVCYSNNRLFVVMRLSGQLYARCLG